MTSKVFFSFPSPKQQWSCGSTSQYKSIYWYLSLLIFCMWTSSTHCIKYKRMKSRKQKVFPVKRWLFDWSGAIKSVSNSPVDKIYLSRNFEYFISSWVGWTGIARSIAQRVACCNFWGMAGSHFRFQEHPVSKFTKCLPGFCKPSRLPSPVTIQPIF